MSAISSFLTCPLLPSAGMAPLEGHHQMPEQRTSTRNVNSDQGLNITVREHVAYLSAPGGLQ